jgi:hypothetical protein
MSEELSNARDGCKALAALLPRHAASLTITHNDHLDYYETVAEQVASSEWVKERDFVSAAELQKAISTNELWCIQWYPDTPIGFHKRFASTLEALFSEPLPD